MTQATTTHLNDGRLRPRERDNIVNPLRSGVVPRLGYQHIQVGRAAEIAALLKDRERVADGGSAVRFMIGEYGAGKTFLMALNSAAALENKFVTARADLAPDRRLYSTEGHARALYREIMRNLSTHATDGNAIGPVLDRFVTSARQEADRVGEDVDEVLARRLRDLSNMTDGYSYAHVVRQYWQGHLSGDETVMADAVRWLRAEYTSRRQALADLGVPSIIDDRNAWDNLKLLAVLVRLAGFDGLLVCIDELVNVNKLTTQARNANIEQVLRIVNDLLQGRAEGLFVCFGGTPDSLEDTRRGLYSYPALRSRLAPNPFARNGLTDTSGPVLRLPNLTPEDLYVLLTRLRHVYAYGDQDAYLLPDEALHAFMQHCQNRIGDAYFRTPRQTIVEFLNLLAVLEENPQSRWDELISQVHAPLVAARDLNGDASSAPDTDCAPDDARELDDFKLGEL